jgi:hypothetical protein
MSSDVSPLITEAIEGDVGVVNGVPDPELAVEVP